MEIAIALCELPALKRRLQGCVAPEQPGGVVLLAGAAVVVLIDAQHKMGSSCFTPGGKLHSLLPTPQPLYQGRATHKLMGTPDRVAMRWLLVWFLLLMVVEVILLAHRGGWTVQRQVLHTCTLSTLLERWRLERQNKSWIFAERMF